MCLSTYLVINYARFYNNGFETGHAKYFFSMCTALLLGGSLQLRQGIAPKASKASTTVSVLDGPTRLVSRRDRTGDNYVSVTRNEKQNKRQSWLSHMMTAADDPKKHDLSMTMVESLDDGIELYSMSSARQYADSGEYDTQSQTAKFPSSKILRREQTVSSIMTTGSEDLVSGTNPRFSTPHSHGGQVKRLRSLGGRSSGEPQDSAVESCLTDVSVPMSPLLLSSGTRDERSATSTPNQRHGHFDFPKVAVDGEKRPLSPLVSGNNSNHGEWGDQGTVMASSYEHRYEEDFVDEDNNGASLRQSPSVVMMQVQDGWGKVERRNTVSNRFVQRLNTVRGWVQRADPVQPATLDSNTVVETQIPQLTVKSSAELAEGPGPATRHSSEYSSSLDDTLTRTHDTVLVINTTRDMPSRDLQERYARSGSSNSSTSLQASSGFNRCTAGSPAALLGYLEEDEDSTPSYLSDEAINVTASELNDLDHGAPGIRAAVAQPNGHGRTSVDKSDQPVGVSHRLMSKWKSVSNWFNQNRLDSGFRLGRKGASSTLPQPPASEASHPCRTSTRSSTREALASRSPSDETSTPTQNTDVVSDGIDTTVLSSRKSSPRLRTSLSHVVSSVGQHLNINGDYHRSKLEEDEEGRALFDLPGKDCLLAPGAQTYKDDEELEFIDPKTTHSVLLGVSLDHSLDMSGFDNDYETSTDPPVQSQSYESETKMDGDLVYGSAEDLRHVELLEKPSPALSAALMSGIAPQLSIPSQHSMPGDVFYERTMPDARETGNEYEVIPSIVRPLQPGYGSSLHTLSDSDANIGEHGNKSQQTAKVMSGRQATAKHTTSLDADGNAIYATTTTKKQHASDSQSLLSGPGMTEREKVEHIGKSGKCNREFTPEGTVGGDLRSAHSNTAIGVPGPGVSRITPSSSGDSMVYESWKSSEASLTAGSNDNYDSFYIEEQRRRRLRIKRTDSSHSGGYDVTSPVSPLRSAQSMTGDTWLAGSAAADTEGKRTTSPGQRELGEGNSVPVPPPLLRATYSNSAYRAESHGAPSLSSSSVPSMHGSNYVSAGTPTIGSSAPDKQRVAMQRQVVRQARLQTTNSAGSLIGNVDEWSAVTPHSPPDPASADTTHCVYENIAARASLDSSFSANSNYSQSGASRRPSEYSEPTYDIVTTGMESHAVSQVNESQITHLNPVYDLPATGSHGVESRTKTAASTGSAKKIASTQLNEVDEPVYSEFHGIRNPSKDIPGTAAKSSANTSIYTSIRQTLSLENVPKMKARAMRDPAPQITPGISISTREATSLDNNAAMLGTGMRSTLDRGHQVTTGLSLSTREAIPHHRSFPSLLPQGRGQVQEPAGQAKTGISISTRDTALHGSLPSLIPQGMGGAHGPTEHVTSGVSILMRRTGAHDGSNVRPLSAHGLGGMPQTENPIMRGVAISMRNPTAQENVPSLSAHGRQVPRNHEELQITYPNQPVGAGEHLESHQPSSAPPMMEGWEGEHFLGGAQPMPASPSGNVRSKRSKTRKQMLLRPLRLGKDKRSGNEDSPGTPSHSNDSKAGNDVDFPPEIRIPSSFSLLADVLPPTSDASSNPALERLMFQRQQSAPAYITPELNKRLPESIETVPDKRLANRVNKANSSPMFASVPHPAEQMSRAQVIGSRASKQDLPRDSDAGNNRSKPTTPVAAARRRGPPKRSPLAQ